MIKNQRAVWEHKRQRAAKFLAHSLISPKVVREFVARPRDDHRWMKTLDRAQLERIVYDVWPHFHTKPYLHQLVCIALGIIYPEFLFLLDMGLGKTAIILNLLRYYKASSGLQQTLVLVPSAVNAESWVKQIAKHAPQLTYQKLLGNAEEREALIETDADLCLMNYAGLMVYMTKFERDTRKRAKGKMRRVPIAARVRGFTQRFNGLVLDESHKLGDEDSLVSRLVAKVRKQCFLCYAGTGTLFGRNPLRAWSQFKLVDNGVTLGDTLPLFRQAFCHGSVNHFGGVEWKFDNSKEQLLHTLLQHRSIRYEDAECQDLPKLVEETVQVELSEEQKIYYNRALAKLKEARGDFRSLNNPFMRLRQVTAGFLGMRNEEDERLEVVFTENAKLEALQALMENVPLGSKAVIFHEFKMSGRLIEEVMKGLGVKYALLSGNVKNPIAEYNRFLQDTQCQALIANSASGGTGIDELQYVSRFVVFYELPVDPSTFRQALKRVYRTGQVNRVYRYILEASGTVDERVWGFIQQGRNLFQAICNGERDSQLKEV